MRRSEADRNDRAARLAVIVAAYISSLFLSLLCDIAYNEWAYEREGAAASAALTPLVVFSLLVLCVVSCSLLLIVRGAFQASMDGRVRQLGILASVGATPRQLRARLVREAALLCALPVPLGCLTGTALGYTTLQAVNRMAMEIAGRRPAVWRFGPPALAAALLLSAVTVLAAAWLPARKLARISPLAAVRYAGEPAPKRKGRFPLLSRLFGVEGELAGNALKARRKALRTATLSLTLAFLGFTLMLCFLTLSEISTDHTYFERYQGAWDVMLTVKNTDMAELTAMDAIRALDGAEDVTAYQKAAAQAMVADGDLSDGLNALGGPGELSGGKVSRRGDGWQLSAPLTVLDDRSFLTYCQSAGVPGRLDGALALNRIWDSAHSGFRYPVYAPYLREGVPVLSLQGAGGAENGAAVPLLGYAQEPPLLREAYDNYALPVFLPLSLWKELAPALGGNTADTVIRILAKEKTPECLDALEAGALEALGPNADATAENRLRERRVNDQVLRGYRLILGGLCGLLAVIGLANVFTFALTFLSQRRRELARYQSLGMTPGSMKKLFCVEALIIAGRPLLITLPLTVAAVSLMIRLSDLNPAEFWVRAPYGPAALFALAIFAFVGLAYWLGGRRALRDELAEALQGE